MKRLRVLFTSPSNTALACKILAVITGLGLLCALVLFVYGSGAVGDDDLHKLKTQYPVLTYAKQSGEQRNQVSFKASRPYYWVKLSSLPKSSWGAMVVSEDWAFFEHNGADFAQIWKAFRDFALGTSRLRGASTITQQVAKNVFLSHERSVWRKVKEYFVGREIEETLSKNEILEVYINIVELGDGIVGIQRAAQHYFYKDASALTPKEAAFLAYLLPSPVRYSKVFKDRALTRYSSKRVRQILLGMLQARYISQEVYQSERGARLSFESTQEQVGDNDVIEAGDDELEALEDEMLESEFELDESQMPDNEMTDTEMPDTEMPDTEPIEPIEPIEQSFEDPSLVDE